MPDSIQLSQHILGLEPYVLVTVTGAEDDDSLNVKLEFGGGLERKRAIELLKAVIETAEESNIG